MTGRTDGTRDAQTPPAGHGPVDRLVVRLYTKRADWRNDVHAYECYSCAQRSNPPASTPQCKGCIGRQTRPHWMPHPDYAAEARQAIQAASGKTHNVGGEA